jgi:hypothetical protein
MRRFALCLALVSCHGETTPRYVRDAGYRMEALRASVTDETEYGRLRLAQYAEWEQLPEDDGGLAIPATLDRSSLVALGKQAFERYVSQPPFTCATCHSYRGVAGAPNIELDVGAMLIEKFPHAPASARAIAYSWGPGRVDVTTQTGTEPARIPDLRPVRFLRYLQWSGAVKQNDIHSLALRIETLVITSSNYSKRMPHAMALGLAMYVWSLADSLPMTEPPSSFVRACGDCHEGPGLSGGLIDVDEVGTDPTLARSADRGTGFYRVPSLRGVGSRGPLMHDGSIRGLDALLDSHGPALSGSERTEILAYLSRL